MEEVVLSYFVAFLLGQGIIVVSSTSLPPWVGIPFLILAHLVHDSLAVYNFKFKNNYQSHIILKAIHSSHSSEF